MPQNESSIDKAIRLHSEAVHESRMQRANDQLLMQGKPAKHCRVEARLNSLGDWECVRCGEVGF